MKHKKLWIAAGIAVLALAGTGIWALAAAETSVTNNLSTSVVDIGLENYKSVDGKEVPFTEEDKKVMVMPGMRISQIPRLTNKAEDCYVRAGISIDGKKEVERPLSLGDISGFEETWVKKGEYYYHKDILKTGESTRLFDTVTIPSEWETRYDENGVKDHYTLNDWEITVRVDAIQAGNLTPDFNSDSPWGIEGKDYAIQKCIQEEGYEFNIYQKEEPPEFTVVYEGESGKLITSQEDFFAGIPRLLPGDKQEGVFTMKNDGERKQTFYFRTEILEEQDILEQILLSIQTGEKIIYKGPLNARKLQGYVSLCSLEKGKQQEVSFTLTVPKELDNRYTLNNCKVRWLFKTEEEPEKALPVKTGDTLSAVPWAAAFAGASLIVVLCRKKKRGKKC